MRLLVHRITPLWLKMLNLPRQTQPSWHRDRLREELQERRHAETGWSRLSETSDVLFSIIRAEHDGFVIHRISSLFRFRCSLIWMYMLAKYTSRWYFFKTAALLSNVQHWDTVCEVVNPAKDEKLAEVACRHSLDPQKFQRVSCRLRKVWFLFP